MAALAFHVVSGSAMEVSFLPSGFGAERLTELGESRTTSFRFISANCVHTVNWS